jgi:hypothetical protein
LVVVVVFVVVLNYLPRSAPTCLPSHCRGQEEAVIGKGPRNILNCNETMIVDIDPLTTSKNQNNPPRTYCHYDVEVLNLVSDPIWIFDVLNKTMWWGNTAALAFWNVKSLEEFTTRRNYAENMSDTEQQRNMDTLERLKRNETIKDYVVRPVPKKGGGQLVFILFVCLLVGWFVYFLVRLENKTLLSHTFHFGMVPHQL